MFTFTTRRSVASSAVASAWSKRAIATGFVLLAAAPARADYVGSLTNRIFIDPATLAAVSDGFDNGDEFAYILETTPRDTGSDVGMAAWATVYIPPGVQVIGASFVQPAGGGLFSQKNAESGDKSYAGCGKRGCKAYVPTTGTTRLDDGSVGEVNQDTGIFYSTDPRTQNQLTQILPQLTPTGPKTKPATIFNQWDYDQVAAFGTASALSGNKGTGNTPLVTINSASTWTGTGAMVAGPLTRYTNDYNPACNGAAACTGTAGQCAFAADLQCVGPWQRIAYPGSRFGGAGTITPQTVQGLVGNTSVVTALGATLSSGSPLPANTNAVRFVHGTRNLGELEYSRIVFRVTDATAFINSLDTDTFCLESTGGDTSQVAAKDNPWRYYEPAHKCFQELAAQSDNALLLKATTHVNGGASGGEFLQSGDVISYSVTFTNIGGTALTNVLLSDTPTTNLHLIEPGNPNCAYANYNGNIPGPNYNAGSATTQTATWASIPSISPGSSVTVHMCATVDNANSGELVQNTGHVTYTIPGVGTDSLDSTATGTIFETANIDLSVVKSDSPDPVGQGDNVVYTLLVSNAGPETANNIEVEDELSPDTTYVSDDGGCTHLAGVVTCDIASLASGASTTIHITVTVSGTAPTGGSLQASPCDGTEDICNNVSVSADENDTDLSDNEDSEPTDVVECNDNADCDSDGVFCNGPEVCVSGTCGHAGDPCVGGGVCGDLCNEVDDNCFDPAGTVCRAGSGICDPQETCTGSSASCPLNGFTGTGTVCRDGAGVCDPPENCDGSGSCPANNFAGTGVECRAGNGICDPAENCDGSGSCTPDAFAGTGVECRAGNGICDPAENCDGSGACTPNGFAGTGVECRAGNGVCDPAENCDGSGACTPNGFAGTGVQCRAGNGICDPAENCDGAGACAPDAFTGTGVECRAGNGICDPAETCDGSGACTANGFAGTGVQCRAGNGVCDPPENCDGSGACTPNAFAGTGVQCRAGNGVCDPAETCDGSGACTANGFAGTGVQCRAGNGVCDPPENCDGSGACTANGFAGTGVQCRAGNGICDPAENCDGSGSCAPDAFTGTGVQCRAGNGVCDPAETCDGSGACSPNAFSGTGVQCRAGNGVCDPPENCDGSGACTANGFAGTGVTCRAGNGVCDPAETCDGSGACTANGFAGTGVQCRAGNGVCDPPENCDGSGACTANGFAGTGVQCRAGNGVCDPPENCNGSGSCAANAFADTNTICRNSVDQCDAEEKCNGAGSCSPNVSEHDGAACDDGLFCTGPDQCISGSCSGSPIDCDDGVSCTDDACNETLNACTHGPDNSECSDGDPCTSDVCDLVNGCENDFVCGADICRTAGYWSTHGGYGKANSYNVTQAVLDAAGGIDVCGEHIDSTSNLTSPWVAGLGLDSALEGLCVAVRGNSVRQLYRQLIAAALNCAISGQQDCDNVVLKYIDLSFSECSELCETGVQQQGGPTVGQCIAQIDCFNNGGQYYQGKCVFGYCQSNPGQGCGGDSGNCPGNGTCVPFTENCHNAPLCNEGLGVCPKKAPASSVKACGEAKGNTCTIDSCPP